MNTLIVSLILASTTSLLALSPFEKVGQLRFGNEAEMVTKSGKVDLSTLPERGYFHVIGELLFIPGEHLPTEYIEPDILDTILATKEIITTEANLKANPRPIKNIEKLETVENRNTHFGTFLIPFINVKPGVIGFDLPRFYHSIKIYAVDRNSSQLLLEYGDVSQGPSEVESFYQNAASMLSFNATGDFYLYAHVAGPTINSKTALNFPSFYVGPANYLNDSFQLTDYIARGISGGFAIMTLFYFFIFLFRPQDRSSLYVSLYALSCFGLSIIYNKTLDITPNQMLSLFTVINIAGIAAIQHYLINKLNFKFSDRTVQILLSISKVALVAATIGILLKVFTLVGILFMLGFVASFVLIGAVIYYGIKNKLNGIVFFCIGATLNAVFQYPILVSYVTGDNKENGYYVLIASFCMAVSLALVNAKEFAMTYRKSVKLGRDLQKKNIEIMEFNKNLEKMVHDKTREVRALLDYIPQGVLSILSDGQVSKDYSAHLSQVLETADIEGKSFKELILNNCKMSSDQKDQAWQALLAMIGESEFNFDANLDKLPQEIDIKLGKTNKILKITWNYQANDEGDIERILVTLLDITVEKALEKESEKQRIELQKIHELINVSAEKVAQFFATAVPLLEEIQSIVEKNYNLDRKDLNTLFVNAHTVKGAARTLHLGELTDVIHQMEDYYSDILRNGVDIEQDRLKRDIKRSISVLDNYKTINEHKLNRSANYRTVSIDRDFIEGHYRFIKDLIKGPIMDPQGFIDLLHNQTEALTHVIFEQLTEVFKDYKIKATKIAEDLRKTPPEFKLEIDEVAIPPDRRVILDNCMVHILRNILDHGIESSDERKAKGKTKEGHIYVTGTESEDVLHLTIGDDGRGLSIKRLLELGKEKGILNEQSSQQEIANLIFKSGVSTVKKISMVSGRGVGMNAVREFLEKANGSIEIVLEEPNNEKEMLYKFHFEIRLPLHDVDHKQTKAS